MCQQETTQQQLRRRLLLLASFCLLAAAFGLSFVVGPPAAAQLQGRDKKPTPPADGSKTAGGEKRRQANPTPTDTPPAGNRQTPSGGRAGTAQAAGNSNSARSRTATGDVTGDGRNAQATAANSNTSVPKPTGKNLSDKQKTNVNELVKDLQDIKSGSTVTPDQINALAASLKTLAQGTTKPNPATVDKLAADLADVISDGGISNSDMKLLADDLKEVLNSANVPQSEIDAVIANAQAIFVASGVNKGDALEVQADLQAIAKELKKNVGAAKANLPAAAASGAKRKRP